MHERASRPRHRRWILRPTTTTTTTKMAPMDRRRRRSTAHQCAPDGDASPTRLDVDDILHSLMSSQVRCRLLAAALEYAVEATMNDFPGANTDARGPPVAAAYLRGFLQKNLGANLHIDRHKQSPSPAHALLASLPPERPGGEWTDDDAIAAGRRAGWRDWTQDPRARPSRHARCLQGTRHQPGDVNGGVVVAQRGAAAASGRGGAAAARDRAPRGARGGRRGVRAKGRGGARGVARGGRGCGWWGWSWGGREGGERETGFDGD